ncbi:MAG: hypothetical protein AAFO69_11930 [Bacteroidota bacterium]
MKSRYLMLYRLNRLVKALCPHVTTKNPYQSRQTVVKELLDEEEQLLFNDVLHSITLLNSYSRLTGNRQLNSTESDYLNALQLMLPNEMKLNERVLDCYQLMQDRFGERAFNYLEVRSLLSISQSSLRRLLQPLLLHGLVQKERPGNSGKAQLYVKTKVFEVSECKELFEEAQGDWKDFHGYIEF